MKNTEILTDSRIRNYQCDVGKGYTFLWDSRIPGLGVRATANGAKTFIYQTKLGRNTIRLSIGSTKVWDKLDDVRKEARRLRSLVDRGIDPREQRAEQQAKRDAERAKLACQRVTVSEAWQHYIAYQKDKMARPNLGRGKKWGDRHLLDHERMAHLGGVAKVRGKGKTKPGVLAPLMNLRMGSITSKHIVDWVSAEANERANGARQGFEAFRAFWRWCLSRDEYKSVIARDLFDSKEIRDYVPSRRTTGADEDVLERQHLKAWFEAVRCLSNPVLSAYLQGLLVTGARREELAFLKWADVDFKWGAIWLKDKVDESGQRKVPLTPYLQSLIEQLPRRNEWVFSSPTSESGRITEPRIAHNRALDFAGLPHVSLHGLRRSFISLSEWVEIPTGIVAQIAGHKPSATAERHYKRRPLDLLFIWHAKFENWMLEQAEVEFASSKAGSVLMVVS